MRAKIKGKLTQLREKNKNPLEEALQKIRETREQRKIGLQHMGKLLNPLKSRLTRELFAARIAPSLAQLGPPVKLPVKPLKTVEKET